MSILGMVKTLVIEQEEHSAHAVTIIYLSEGVRQALIAEQKPSLSIKGIFYDNKLLGKIMEVKWPTNKFIVGAS